MRYTLLATVLVAATSCGYVEETIDLDRTGPDEYDVSVAAPLTVPPEFTLRPPTPGAVRPQEVRADEKAREALLGTADAATPITVPSSAESAILNNTKSYASKPVPDGSVPQPEVMRALSNNPVPESVTAPTPSSLPEDKVLQAPATTNDASAPRIEMESKDDDKPFWDSWF